MHPLVQGKANQGFAQLSWPSRISAKSWNRGINQSKNLAAPPRLKIHSARTQLRRRPRCVAYTKSAGSRESLVNTSVAVPLPTAKVRFTLQNWLRISGSASFRCLKTIFASQKLSRIYLKYIGKICLMSYIRLCSSGATI